MMRVLDLRLPIFDLKFRALEFQVSNLQLNQKSQI